MRSEDLPVSIALVHSRVDEEAREAELTDLAGQQFHALGAVAEDDRLRDVQFGEQRVQTVELLALFQVSVVLSHSLQSQLVRDLDKLGLGHVALLKLPNLNRVGRTEEANLTVEWHHFQNLLHHFLELA